MLWLDPVTVGQSLKVIVPWGLKAIANVPNFACPQTIKTQLTWWLNWLGALSTDSAALAGVCSAINAETQAQPPAPVP